MKKYDKIAIEIIWSEEAKDTFDENIHYLQKEWTDKEINKFILQTQKVIQRLESFPEAYPLGIQNKKYRKAKLNNTI